MFDPDVAQVSSLERHDCDVRQDQYSTGTTPTSQPNDGWGRQTLHRCHCSDIDGQNTAAHCRRVQELASTFDRCWKMITVLHHHFLVVPYAQRQVPFNKVRTGLGSPAFNRCEIMINWSQSVFIEMHQKSTLFGSISGWKLGFRIERQSLQQASQFNQITMGLGTINLVSSIK